METNPFMPYVGHLVGRNRMAFDCGEIHGGKLSGILLKVFFRWVSVNSSFWLLSFFSLIL
jgi:hypothetical protein